MRSPSIASVVFVKEDPPSDPARLQDYLRGLEARTQTAIMALAAGHLDKTHTEPSKPRDGDIRYADGANWQPNGSGSAGIYYYNGTTWVFLG